MNVKEYINSGIVESCVLGLATDAERQEFEQLCASYPEIAAARDAFERSLESQLLRDAVAPPPLVRQKVLEAVGPPTTENSSPVEEPETPVRRLNVWKWVAAASLLLLAASAYWAVSTNAKYADLQARQASLENDLQQKNERLAALQQDARLLQKEGMKMVSLKGTAEAPQAYTTVYWDTTGATKDVYLLVNNLPQPASDKQYQLWAILDKQPVDLGVFEYEVRQERLLIKMKNAQNAQAFAITLERRGRPNPEKPEGQIFVVGNL